jgi:hypothetical protein
MRAPGDQRKSSYIQREEAELNPLQCQQQADASKQGLLRTLRESGSFEPNSISRDGLLEMK